MQQAMEGGISTYNAATKEMRDRHSAFISKVKKRLAIKMSIQESVMNATAVDAQSVDAD